MYDDYNLGGRWVTINGRHVFIDTNKYMNSFIKGKGYDAMQKQKGDEVMNELKEKYPNGQYENEDGIEKISIHDVSLLNDENNNFGGYYETTQKILNEMPLSLNMYFTDDWGEFHQSHYIYRNKSQLFKDLKNYGGLNQMTDFGKIQYSITSQSGKGEYFLERDKFTKGGWVWKDSNNQKVNGREQAEINKIRNKRFIEKYGQEEYDKFFK